MEERRRRAHREVEGAKTSYIERDICWVLCKDSLVTSPCRCLHHPRQLRLSLLVHLGACTLNH